MGGAVSSGSTNDELVDNLVDGSCIRTREVERAFRMVDRAEYFLPRSRSNAYKDVAWKSGHYHLSAPCVYSEVMEGLCLKPGNSFLNIGSGTGYLSTMAGLLLGTNGINHGIEIHEDLVFYARHKLEMFKKHSGAVDEFEFCEPYFAVGNGLCLSHGKLGDFREYDRVYCGAACPEAFEAQVWRLVAVGGILVMPCNDQLLQLRRTAGDTWDACPLLGVTFAILVPPLSDIEYTEEERKEHLHIAMTLFRATPSSLQHLCRSLIRTTLRTNITQAQPTLYKPARKPPVNPKSSRRASRSSTNSDDAQTTTSGTQRVTLSLGSNGRLNINRNGMETEACRRARARLLGQRLIHARGSGVEAREGEANGDAGRCVAVDVERERGEARDVGVSGRRALAQAVGNYRVERLLEHLCQEMILEPITDENEQSNENSLENSLENEDNNIDILRNVEEFLSMELTNDNNRSDDPSTSEENQQDIAEEGTLMPSKKEPPENGSSTSKFSENSNIIVIHVNDENEEMETTDSEKENLTETENVTIELNPSSSTACTCPSSKTSTAPQNTCTTTSTSSSAETTSGKMEVDATDFTPENKKPHHRFAGFRFHNQPAANGTSSTHTSNNKRSSSNSSLKKSSKRRQNHHATSKESSSSSSSSSSDTQEESADDDDDDDDSGSSSETPRRRYGSHAQIVHLISSSLEANNNNNIMAPAAGDLSTDDDDDDVDGDSEEDADEEVHHRHLQGDGHLVVRSEYTRFMVEGIGRLPLPRKMLVYVNYDRELEKQTESEQEEEAQKQEEEEEKPGQEEEKQED